MNVNRFRKWGVIVLTVAIVTGMAGCAAGGEASSQESVPTASSAAAESSDLGFRMVSQEETKQMMDTETGYIILDVRTQEEYDTLHIPGAVLIPDYEVWERAEAELPDKNQLILVYCRSGRRSKVASLILADLGYTNVVEFGGINTWEYETEGTAASEAEED